MFDIVTNLFNCPSIDLNISKISLLFLKTKKQNKNKTKNKTNKQTKNKQNKKTQQKNTTTTNPQNQKHDIHNVVGYKTSIY